MISANGNRATARFDVGQWGDRRECIKTGKQQSSPATEPALGPNGPRLYGLFGLPDDLEQQLQGIEVSLLAVLHLFSRNLRLLTDNPGGALCLLLKKYGIHADNIIPLDLQLALQVRDHGLDALPAVAVAVERPPQQQHRLDPPFQHVDP